MDEPRGFLISQATSFRGRIFSVTADRVTLPNGRSVTLEIVRHPGSVVLLPLVDHTHIILIRQYRHALDRWIWELPAGSLEPGEDPVTAAARECEEEVGLVPTSVEFAGSWYPTPGLHRSDELLHAHRAPRAESGWPHGSEGRRRGYPRAYVLARRCARPRAPG
jgi:8-oxo-dGTP pyrophosphatase MutT (NUDIX family)